MCPVCSRKLRNRGRLQRHLQREHEEFYLREQIGEGAVDAEQQNGEHITFHLREHALKHTIKHYSANFHDEEANLANLLRRSRRSVFDIFRENLQEFKNIKTWGHLRAHFHKDTHEITWNFTTFSHLLLNPMQVPTVYGLICDYLSVMVEEFTFLKSGWILDKILDFSISLVKCKLFSGSSYIPTPYPLSKKRCIVNIDNSIEHADRRHQKCFLWSILAHPEFVGSKFEHDIHNNRSRNMTKLSHYIDHEFAINDSGITYPMTLEQIPQFEKLNPRLSFTVLCYEIPEETPRNFAANKEVDKYIRDQLHLVYNSKDIKEVHVDLLVLSDKDRSHFTFCRRLESLVAARGETGKASICRNCLQSFMSVENLSKHQVWCLKFGPQQICLPKKGEVVKFKRYCATVKIPFMIVADFESFLPECCDAQDSKTREFISQHDPSGFSWIVSGPDDNILFKNYYRAKTHAENIAFEFVRQLLCVAKQLDEINETYRREAIKTMVLTKKDHITIKTAVDCCICHKPLSMNVGNEIRQKPTTKHHNHNPPYQFLGLAHNFCNLQASLRVNYPIFLHNGGGYDYHFIISALSELKRENLVWDVDVIAKNSENFISIMINKKLKLLDSYLFTLSSLENLVKSTPPENLRIIHQEFSKEVENGANISLLTRKSVYPYCYMTDISKFDEPLPPRSAFYSDLTGKEIDKEDYQYVQEMWKSFKIKNLGHLHDIYVRSDTSLLMDVMINLRNLLFKEYGVDMAQYLTLAQISKDCLLKLTGVEIELISDSTMHVWVESAIRGGFCGVQVKYEFEILILIRSTTFISILQALRSAKANNKFLPDYDPSQESTFIAYWDATNQYGR
jgi:hypothetical protein